jgi:hypothetical protein
MQLPERARTLLALVVAVGTVAAFVVLVPSVVPPSLADRLGLHREAGLGDPHVGSFRFRELQPGTRYTPVTWDPCRRITYVVNPTGGPPNGVALVQGAVQEVGELTGLQFGFVGISGDRPPGPDDPPPARSYDVLVSWATAAEVPDLKGRTAGIGGARTVGPASGPLRYVDGVVTLDADAFGRTEPRFQRAIILHELGHVVGLDHVPDRTQLMYPDEIGQTDFGAGDRVGLARLGTGPCS